MDTVRFGRVVKNPEGGWSYLPFEVSPTEVLSVIPFPLPPGQTDINHVIRQPEWKNWPFGGCVILLKNGMWIHLNESLDSVESSILD